MLMCTLALGSLKEADMTGVRDVIGYSNSRCCNRCCMYACDSGKPTFTVSNRNFVTQD